MGKFSNTQLAVGAVLVVLAAGVISLGPGWGGGGVERELPQNPDVADLEPDGPGAMGEAREQDICNECDRLQAELDEKIKERIDKFMEDSGCSLRTDGAAGGDYSGTSSWQGTSFDWDCPSQGAAESLGEAFADAKDNRSDLDKEIDDLEEQLENMNCPCFHIVHQCVVCAGVPPNGLCPTHFVVSQEECTALGGEFIRNTEAEAMYPDLAN